MPKVKLVDVASEEILKMIENHEYDERGYLPSEGELTIRFDMSRATVREAVRSVEMRGFVQRIHGKGVKVLDNSLQVVTRSLTDMMTKDGDTLKELLEMRTMLEPEGAALAARNRTERDIEILEEHVKMMNKSEIMDSAYHEADLGFHIQLAKATGNKILASFIEAYTGVLRELIIESIELTNSDKPI